MEIVQSRKNLRLGQVGEGIATRRPMRIATVPGFTGIPCCRVVGLGGEQTKGEASPSRSIGASDHGAESPDRERVTKLGGARRSERGGWGMPRSGVASFGQRSTSPPSQEATPSLPDFRLVRDCGTLCPPGRTGPDGPLFTGTGRTPVVLYHHEASSGREILVKDLEGEENPGEKWLCPIAIELPRREIATAA